MGAQGTRFEFECYDVGHLYNLAHFLDRGLVKPPLFVQTIFGILGGIGPDVENLLHMKRTADRLLGDDYLWSVLGAGRHQTQPRHHRRDHGRQRARRPGGQHLPVAQGSSRRATPSRWRRSCRILRELSLEVATPDEAREMLALKGPDATKIPTG